MELASELGVHLGTRVLLTNWWVDDHFLFHSTFEAEASMSGWRESWV
jgi:hypothetical protein